MNRTVSCFVVLAGLALLVLSGCSPVTLKGRVIAGDLSMIAVVDADDPRLDGPGIEGVKLTVYQTGRSGDTVSKTSNSKGSFSVPLKGTGALSHPLTFEAKLDGYSPASETMPTPVQGQRLLILMQPLRTVEP